MLYLVKLRADNEIDQIIGEYTSLSSLHLDRIERGYNTTIKIDDCFFYKKNRSDIVYTCSRKNFVPTKENSLHRYYERRKHAIKVR